MSDVNELVSSDNCSLLICTQHARSSLSYTFSLFKLTEAKVAEILVSLCRDMGETKISSAGKILFFGSHILKSPEGKAALEPIKSMIMATYRDEEVAETLVETSQRYVCINLARIRQSQIYMLRDPLTLK